jgi:hypothetical protein
MFLVPYDCLYINQKRAFSSHGYTAMHASRCQKLELLDRHTLMDQQLDALERSIGGMRSIVGSADGS